MKRFFWYIFLLISMIVIFSGIAAGGYYAYEQFFVAPSHAPVEESVLERVSKLIVLPEDETPTIVSVSDLAELRDQPFFANAKAGDRVLVYTRAKKAILYDPVANKIVEVAPITLAPTATSTATTTAQ